MSRIAEKGRSASRQETCCQCGMARGEWTANEGRGYQRDGWRYCCERCADETGCSCFEAARLAALMRPKRRVARAAARH